MIDKMTADQVYELTALAEPYALALADAVLLKHMAGLLTPRIRQTTPSPHDLSAWLNENYRMQCKTTLHHAVRQPKCPAEDALRLAVINEMQAREYAAEMMEEAV